MRDNLYAAYCRAVSALVDAEIYASRFNSAGYSRPDSAPAPPKGRRASRRHAEAAAKAWAWVERAKLAMNAAYVAYKA